MRKVFLALALVAVLSLVGFAVLPQTVAGVAVRTQTQATPVPQAANTQSAPVIQDVPAGITDLQDALSNVYETVSPSVVNISVVMNAISSQPALPDIPEHEGLPELPDIPNLPFDFGPDVPGGFGGAALGSGFVWDTQGHIVTNNHVVAGAGRISVTFSDGLTVPAEVVGRDSNSDLAVLKVDPSQVEDLRPVTVGDSTQIKVGQFVLAIGNPFGLEGSMSFGIVSALGRTLPVGSSLITTGASYTIPDIIQTDAPVNPGNSGGVLLDLQGRLIGVPTAIESSTRSSAGVGFAVPSVIVQKVVPELIRSGEIEHPYIGIRGGTLSSNIAEAMNLPANTRGALVVEVTEDSPAAKAGLRGSTETVQIDGLDAQIGGDVITAIDGQTVRDFEDLTTYLARVGRVGQNVNLTILRDGNIQSVTVTLAARPEEQVVMPETIEPQPESPVTPGAGAPWLGISGRTLTDELADAMDLPGRQGVLVGEVVPGSPADKAGLQGSEEPFDQSGEPIMIGGDVITAVDDQDVASIDELIDAIQAREAGDEVTLTIVRDGEEQTVNVTLEARGGVTQQGGPSEEDLTPTPESDATPQADVTPETGTTPQADATPEAGTTPQAGATPESNVTPETESAPAASNAWLGINGLSVPTEMAQMLGLGDQRGVLILNVVNGSPADEAGLRGAGAGFGQGRMLNADIIVAADDQDIATMEDLVDAIQAKQAGDTMTLTVLRDGQQQDVTVTLGERPQQ